MASDELYFTLKLRDEFSDTLRDMQSELDQLHAKLRQATDGTSNATASKSGTATRTRMREGARCHGSPGR